MNGNANTFERCQLLNFLVSRATGHPPVLIQYPTLSDRPAVDVKQWIELQNAFDLIYDRMKGSTILYYSNMVFKSNATLPFVTLVYPIVSPRYCLQ